jgi:hypothetical protein
VAWGRIDELIGWAGSEISYAEARARILDASFRLWSPPIPVDEFAMGFWRNRDDQCRME